MPLDLSMLLSASHTSYAPLTASPLLDEFLMDADGEPPFACRRVASFPMVNRHFPKPSNLKCRSLSENCLMSNGKNGCHLTVQDFQRELSSLLMENNRNDYHDKCHDSEHCNHEACDHVVVFTDEDVDKSVVIVKDNDDTESANNNLIILSTPTNNKKSKRKKVLFADDFGRDLFTIRVMTEASDMPPKLTSPVVRAILGIGEDEFASDIEARPTAQWVLDFAQPASEYMQFRQTLESQNIGLENVVVKNDSCRLNGTVKVKNICFSKTVFIRYTDNNWASYNDRECKYMAPSKSRTAGQPDTYDTFQFDIEIPCDDDQREVIEFCVCFRTDDGREFWDSFGGKNFRIVSEKYRLRRTQNQPTTGQQNKASSGQQHIHQRRDGGLTRQSSTDAYELNRNNWSEFSSWSDLSTEGPYW